MKYKRGDKVRVHDKTFGIKASRCEVFKEVMKNDGIAYVVDVLGKDIIGLQATPLGRKGLYHTRDVTPYESTLEGVEEL